MWGRWPSRRQVRFAVATEIVFTVASIQVGIGLHRGPGWVLLAGAAGALYFAPWLIACLRGRAGAGYIGFWNLFTGWSIIGWVIALILALGPVPRSYLDSPGR